MRHLLRWAWGRLHRPDPPPAAAGTTVQGRSLGSTWLLLTGRGAGNTPPGRVLTGRARAQTLPLFSFSPKNWAGKCGESAFCFPFSGDSPFSKQQPWVERVQVNETLNNVKF